MTNTTAWLIKCLLASIVIFVTFITIFVLFVVFPNNSVQNAFDNAVDNLNADPMYCRTDINDHSCYNTESVCTENAFVCKKQHNIYCTISPRSATVTLINRAGESRVVQGSEKVRYAVLSGQWALDPNQSYSILYEEKVINTTAERLTHNIVENTDFEIIEDHIFCVDSSKHWGENIGKDYNWVQTNRNELGVFCRTRKDSDTCR